MATYNSSFSDSSEMVADAKQYASGSIAKLVTYGLLDRDEYLEKIKTVLGTWTEGVDHVSSVLAGIRFLPPGAGSSDIQLIYGFFAPGSEGGGDEMHMFTDDYIRREKLIGDLEHIKGLIRIIESVNGYRFVSFDHVEGTSNGLWASQSFYYGTKSLAEVYCSVSSYQVSLLEASYNELVDALYYGLALETRLKPYMDTIVMTPGGADLSGLKQMLADRWAEDRLAAYGDLADLVHSGGNVLRDLGWEPLDLLREWSAYAKNDPELSALMATLHVVEGATASGDRDIVLGQDANETIYGIQGHDVLDGGKGDDYVFGYAGDDTILGGAGDDHLYGDEGSDTLIGGSGNDQLLGGSGNDVYRFGRGDGQDWFCEGDVSPGNFDVIELGAGITVDNIKITRSENAALILNFIGSTDKITVAGYFNGDGLSGYLIEEIRFADGTVWDLNKVKALAIQSTGGGDTLYGYATGDAISGGAGNDYIYGKAGDDLLRGDVGGDSLYGEAGNDTLEGGADDDYLYGGQGDDVLVGGVGNDYLYGEAGNDIYRFGRSDGQDIVGENDTTAGNKDVIELGAGISTSDVRITRSGDYMILNILGSTDKVTVSNYFYNDGDSAYLVEEIRFADGTVWDLNKVKELAIQSTDGNDTLYGYATADTISGGAGNDYIYGKAGDDLLRGEGGRDYLYGEAGNDTLEGGGDDDTLSGGEGSDVLRGEEGNDALYGGGGSDVLTGGAGNDYLYGEAGNDVYRFSRGDGQDSVYDYDTTVGNKDVIELGAGISTSDVRITRSGDHMILNIVGSTDKVTVSNYFYNDGDSAYLIEEIRFADGSVLDLNTIKSMAIKSTSGNDSLYGYATADTISGGAGNDYIYGKAGDDLLMGNDDHDYLYGEAGNDTLMGGAGNDYLYGGDGNDLLIGGLGNDSLQGNAGNDTYRLDRGDGQDSVYDYDTTAGNADTMVFGAGISTEQLWFRKVGSNLEVSIIGTEDKMTVSNWYSNTAYRVEQFKTHDGDVLTDGDVQTLVDAMAAFTVPVTGQTVLPDAYQQALAPVIAGCWDLA